MKMFKIALSLFAMTISSLACAELIELDAFNPDYCRQQILKSTDELPIIGTYNSEDTHGSSASFITKFKQLAEDHPERTFFIWDSSEDRLHETQSLCLKQLGFFFPPNMMLVGVFKDMELMTSPLRLQWSGDMSQEEMNQFIDASGFDAKKIRSLIKNR